MRLTMNHVSAAILAAALAMPVAAFAQTSTTTTPQTGTQTGMQNSAATGTDAGMQGESRQQRVEQRISDMYATLKITKGQEAEWNKFAQVMLDNAQAVDQLASKHEANQETASAEQVLKNYSEFAELHAKNVQRLVPAFDRLYAQLTPDQKKMADEMFRARAEEHEQGMKQGEQAPATQKQGG